MRGCRSGNSMAVIFLGIGVLSWQAAHAHTVYTNPTDFWSAINGLGPSIIIDFEDIDASPIDNTFYGRDPFDGSYYAAQGVTFSNPNEYPLYISPGGLFWNASNSLSVGCFPFDPYEPRIYNLDDDLIVALNPSCVAVGFTLVDNDTRYASEFVQFMDSGSGVVAQVGFPPDAFLGIVSLDRPIAAINIVEAPNDEDDVNYDDFITVIPEPATLLSLGLGGLALLRKRRT